MRKTWLITATLLLFLTNISLAEEVIKPSWMKANVSKKTVDMDIVAGFNPNNNNWNFNGFVKGNMTVVVPVDWKVGINFSSIDGNYPHSLVVIDDPGAPDTIPAQAGREEVAIRRAYSKNPLGGLYNDKDTVRFSTKEAGEYLFFCGVPGHGIGGMWVYFKISAEATEPYITVTEDADGRL